MSWAAITSWFGRVGERMLEGLSLDWTDDVASRAVRRSEPPYTGGGAGLWTEHSTRSGRLGELDAVCMKTGCRMYGDQVTLWHVHEPVYRGCHSGFDGDCSWQDCPQLRDNEPSSTGRHCPLDDPTNER